MATFIPSGNIRGPIIHEPVLKLSITAGAKLLYGILCSAANDKDHCWLGLQTMADKLACSISSVKRHLSELKNSGLIAIRHRHGHSSFFTLLPPPAEMRELPDSEQEVPTNCGITETPASSPSGEFNMNCPQATLNSPQPKMDCINNLNKIIQEIPPTPKTGLTSQPPAKTVSSGGGDFSDFEKIYSAYPRKEAKGLAKIAWAQLARNNALPPTDVILAAIQRFSASHNWQRENGRFIPQLSNFLKGERWNDPLSDAEIREKTAKEETDKIRQRHEQEEEQRRIAAEKKMAVHRPVFEAFAAKFKGPFHYPLVFGKWMYLRERGKAPIASDVPDGNELGILDFIKHFEKRAINSASPVIPASATHKQSASNSQNRFFSRGKSYPDCHNHAVCDANQPQSIGKIIRKTGVFMGLKPDNPVLPAMAC